VVEGQVLASWRSLPEGTVTFLLTDVEGSTRLWQERHEDMAAAIIRHFDIASKAIAEHDGVRPIEQGEGDSVVAVFRRASDAVACALTLQLAFASEPWPGKLTLSVRMALHTGEALLRDEGNYAGETISRCARLRALAHGGQTLLSRATYELVVDHLPDGASLMDLGSHRLRDLARPERIYQLCHVDLKEEFPALRSLEAVSNNLPLQVTSFIGREELMGEIRRRLAETRMLTLAGAGGCGKTRLSLEVAAGLVGDHPDGVWWVDLAAISDPDLVANAVAGALGIREVPGQLIAETLVRQLRPRSALVILDNCEHLVEECARLAESLLRSCPTVTLLATSREPLGVDGEIPLRVPSLSFPPGAIEAESSGRYEAVRLFNDRALKARPNFRASDSGPAVAEICQRLDGIPLAIELAAARTRVLTPEQIASELGDVFRLLTGGPRTALPRQRTLEASVEWSYNLLGVDERALMVRLSVFAGSFSLDAVEAVCAGDGIDSSHILDLITSLVDKSLVQVDEDRGASRYKLLETIRHYARQKLVESGDAERARESHLDFFLAFAEQAERELEGTQPAEWLDRIEAEIYDVRAALECVGTKDTARKICRLAGALGIYWAIRRAREGRRHLEAALASEGLDPRVRAQSLLHLATLANLTSDYFAIAAPSREAYAIGAELDDVALMARARAIEGWGATVTDAAASLALLEESEGLARAANDGWALRDAQTALSWRHWSLGDPVTAAAYARDSVTSAERDGLIDLPACLCMLGVYEMFLGEFADSRARFERALAVARAIGDTVWLAINNDALSWLLLLGGRYDEAGAALVEAYRQATESDNLFGLAWNLLHQGWLECVQSRFSEAAEHLVQSADSFALMNVVWARAWTLAVLADAEHALGRTAEATTHLNEADAAASSASNPIAAAFATHTRARLEWADQKLDDAESHELEALELVAPTGCRFLLVEVVESLGQIAAARGSVAAAARLFGAAESGRKLVGSARFPSSRSFDDSLRRVRGALGAKFDDAWGAGAALSLDDAVAYARRGRGKRGRPRAGWASLSPTELAVVGLVAEGLTNPEIGRRLFISPRTVQTHITHVFGKLGVSSRTALAAEAIRRSSSA
jgi:predicted ATPase/class 3 adenylate cyclase/DNA-binding CsgD family transcriptional regulator